MRGFKVSACDHLREALVGLTDTNGGRLNSLDGLRALAAGAVLLCHTYVAPGGHIGVPVFFALSGYLITSILVREYERSGSIDFGRFMFRRLLRLAPAMLAVLVVFSAYDIARSGRVDTPSIRVLPWVISYLGNWKQVTDGVDALGLWGHTWSLAVEQQFYLFWPLVVVVALRPGRWGLVAAAVGLLALVTAPRLISEPSDAYGRATHWAFDSLMIGALLSVLVRDRPALIRQFALLWPVGAAYLVAYTFWPEALHAGGAVAVFASLLSAGSVIAALLLNIGPSKILAARPLVILGRLSYGVYLWHLPVTLALNGHIHNRWTLTAAVAVVSVGGALGSWLLIEHPINALKERPRRVATETAPA